MAEYPLEQFQTFVGYQFRNPLFLREALTHSSFAQESADRPRDNEQMEFLGDAVLTFVVSVILAAAFPDWEEGKLTLEAVLAALYQDGGIAAARPFIERFIMPDDLEACASELFSIDYKSALQERLQAGKMPAAEYRVIEESGPEHQKTFTVEVVAGDNRIARGRGSNKKSAEQEAARSVLAEMEGKTEANG
jgi:ribonuclease-3